MAGNLGHRYSVQPGMSPEDRDALTEAGYDPDDPAVIDRMSAVERGLGLLRQRWHTHTRAQRPYKRSDSTEGRQTW